MNTTLADTLTILAQSLESLRPAGAPAAWAEIIGPFDAPDAVRWHRDLGTLVGFVAPPDCRAIAAVGEGWAHPREGAPPEGVALLKPGERRRCKTVFLLTRSGDTAGYLRSGPTILIDEPGTVGRIPDSVRRCLGLPTPPPDEPTDGFLARLWLNEVAGEGRQAAAPLSWPAVVRLHPAINVATASGLVIPATELIPCLRVASDAWSWTNLRQQAAEPGWLADLLPAGAGGWMDEGILSRWLLAHLNTVEDLLQQATPVVDPAAARKLRVVLRKLDVLGNHHPGWAGVPNT